MTADVFTIGLVQRSCVADRHTNQLQAVEGIREAAARGAQVVCLQELFALPYICKAEEVDRFDLAEPLDGPTVEALRPLATELEVVIVAPLFERRAPGVFHNTAVVIDADGEPLGAYRKMHIPDDPLYYEKFYFTPGDARGPGRGFHVFHTRYAVLGVLICWDQWFPEAARITSLMGAEVLLFPTAIGWHPAEKAEYGDGQVDAWRTVQRGHAIANGVFVAAVNRTGHEPEPGTDGLEFFGQSFICDPRGRLLAEAPADGEAVVVARCHRSDIEQARRDWPYLRDRRVDAYQPILSRLVEEEAGDL